MDIGLLIDQIPPDSIGGAEIQTKQLATELARRGHDVAVFTRRSSSRPYRQWQDGYLVRRRNELPVPGLRMVWDNIPALWNIFRHRPRPQVLLCYQTLNSGLIGIIAQSLFGIPAIVSIRDNTEYRLRDSAMNRLLVPGIYCRARYLIVQSSRILDDLHTQLRLSGQMILSDQLQDRIKVIPNGIRVLPGDKLQLEAIVTGSETLYDQDREFIEKVFGCPVFNRYGSREFGIVAHECAIHHGLHIYTEHAYIECLRNNKPALPGEKGELVITNLSNYGMPFIRYRIGDYGEMSDRVCDCGRGFPLLKSVDGRVFDVVVAPNGRFISGTYWTILFRTVDGIRQFQLVQESVDTLDISLITDSAFQESSLTELEQRIQERCGSDMRIGFELVDDIPLTKAGKRKFIVSEIPMTFGNQ